MPISALFMFILAGTFTPGPNNIMAMNSARKVGFKKSQRFILGMAAGFFLVMFSCALFNLTLAQILPGIQPLLGAVGALYMVYLALRPFFPSSRDKTADPGERHPFITGLALQFINFKVILYGIAIMSGFILPHSSSLYAILFFSALLAGFGFSSLTCWALFGTLFQRLFAQHERAVNTVMALLLFYCAYAISGV